MPGNWFISAWGLNVRERIDVGSPARHENASNSLPSSAAAIFSFMISSVPS